MSVTVRPYKRGGWEVEVRVLLPDGTRVRERKKSPVSTKSGSKRWGERREKALVEERFQPKPEPSESREEVPTLAEFAPRFLENHARANRQKPSTVAAKETILRVHLIPILGSKRLDRISNEDVQRVKNRLHDKARKTVNNVLTVLNTMMKVAVEWNVIGEMPCTIKLLPVAPHDADFHDFHEYERLVDASKSTDPQAHLVVLLGGEAGLRCGDMTSRLAEALRDHRHLRGPRVLSQQDGRPLTQKIVQVLVRNAARKANLANGGVHVLRHSFCSHLAMRGAPARAIQELAGHKDITTTQRYMHLSPAAVVSAIRLLENRNPVSESGDIVETGSGEKVNVRS
jgi:integrase